MMDANYDEGKNMKLYITDGSPYARIVRIILVEKGLSSQVEVLRAKTRTTNSPYYEINPSGRVPYLILDNGLGFEDSALICRYLDHLDGKPVFDLSLTDDTWEFQRIEALARSMLDGLAVLGREKRRPVNEQSPSIVSHEIDRARRLLDLWEQEIDHPSLSGDLNLVQITLVCGLGFADLIPDYDWRDNRPKLTRWFDQISARPSIAGTAPVKK